MRINRHDTNGTKPLLGKGELGYDDYTAGGDTGRVYVGTGTENIALAERLEANIITKAQFNALAEERKANRAGSGWDEFGSNHSIRSGNVNKGIFTPSGVDVVPNQIWLSVEDATSQKTPDGYPFAIIGGVRQKLKSIGANYNKIQLPTAPTIYPHDTVLTAEQIASGVIKHADASNSGLIVNGKFAMDTSGWNNNNNTVLLSSVDGKLQVRYVADRWSYQSIPTVVGKKYKVSFSYRASGGGIYAYFRVGAYVSDQSLYSINTQSTISNTYEIEFTATTSTTFIHCGASNTAGQYAEFDNIAVYPADAISRSDLVFPESYHEDIAEKGVGYPFGNVQYLGENTDGLSGITNGAFTGFETYSLFGNWQTSSALIGKGYVWSSLTEAQKKAFIANPENNCYLDGDKTIQVRYRVRVVQGWGDDWYNVSTQTVNSLSYIEGTTKVRVNVRGKLVSVPEFLVGNNILYQGGLDTQYANNKQVLDGVYKSSNSSAYGYTNECYAIPIALVSRRNQGMYHNVYNPNGTKLASDGLDCFRTTISFTSTMDCFDPAKLLTASGYIGTVSGRPDGLFYDQVHESDILDLRNSSKKPEDYNRLISREFNKLVAGTYRGKEGEIESIVIRTFTKASAFSINANRFYFGITGTSYPEISLAQEHSLEFTLVGSNGSVYNTKQILNIPNVGNMYIPLAGNTQVYIPIDGKNTSASMDTLFPNGTTITVIVSKRTTRTKSNTLLHCDIIGNPTNYPAAWKESGVFGTPLIVAEDGTSLLPNGTLDTFKLSRDANATPLLCLRSTDNGATWTSFTPTFSTTTNAITLTDEPASNLVIVYYQTKTSMAVPAVNSEVLEIGEVLGTNGLANGALVSTLIGKVPTANTAPYSQRGYSVSGYRIDMNTFKFSTTSTELPVHSVLSLAGGAIGVPAVKVLPYLTRANGKAYLNLVFKEMKHNGTSWGDDSKFNIIDNISTTTDLNAQNILYGTKEVEINMFVGADE